MSTVNGTTTTTSTTSMTGTTTAKQPGLLDKDGFLKLLVGQMKNQDPMNPQGGMDIGQMAQMSMVEQITNLGQTTQSLLDETRFSSVLGLVGRNVTYSDANGNPATGLVQNISMSGGTPSLTINGTAGISPDTITQVS